MQVRKWSTTDTHDINGGGEEGEEGGTTPQGQLQKFVCLHGARGEEGRGENVGKALSRPGTNRKKTQGCCSFGVSVDGRKGRRTTCYRSRWALGPPMLSLTRTRKLRVAMMCRMSSPLRCHVPGFLIDRYCSRPCGEKIITFRTA